MATISNMSMRMCRDHRVLSSSGNLSDAFVLESRFRTRSFFQNSKFTVRSMNVSQQNQTGKLAFSNGPLTASVGSPFELLTNNQTLGKENIYPIARRKTKIVCTIGPSTSSREMIWKLAETGMNVARLNMSHGDHASHKKTIDLVKEYNAQSDDNVIAIMLDTKGPEVRSGDVPQPIILKEGQEFNFTIKRGVSTEDTVSVNYDDFINDVEAGDMLLVDGGMMSLSVKSKTKDSVKCVVVDGGELKSRRHLNVRGKSATLPSITDKDWEDIKFGVDNHIDFYAVSFVKDEKVVHELKDYLTSRNADIHVIVKIESADSILNLQSIISASDGAMVARGDLGAELPIEDVPLLQEDIIRRCHNMQKPVIVATNMLESMIDHPTPTRAEVSDIAIAVREGADAVMLSGETAHGKFPLKAVRVMHTVALRTESSLPVNTTAPAHSVYKSHMGEMFAFHATIMANTLSTPIIVFTRTGSMAKLLSHYRPASTIFAFTNEERIKQRLALYQGVMPIYMQFSDDAEETFARALELLLSKGLLIVGQNVTLVQSGAQPIWRRESSHHIQVRKVQA
uniref:Pyruvate kinase n=1 Tax=Salix viminalis TaxID=40686 RepID=A0A6N2JYQ5_SALVM